MEKILDFGWKLIEHEIYWVFVRWVYWMKNLEFLVGSDTGWKTLDFSQRTIIDKKKMGVCREGIINVKKLDFIWRPMMDKMFWIFVENFEFLLEMKIYPSQVYWGWIFYSFILHAIKIESILEDVSHPTPW